MSNPESSIPSKTTERERGAVEGTGGESRERGRSGLEQMTYSVLEPAQKTAAMDTFLLQLKNFLESSGENSRADMMKAVGDAVGVRIDVRQWDRFLAGAYEEGFIRILQRTVPLLEKRFASQFHFPNAHVVAGEVEDQFARVTGEVFVRQLARVSELFQKNKPQGRDYLCVGVVSGSTTRLTIDRICRSNDSKPVDWAREFGVSPKDLPFLKIFALNACPTSPEDLPGNATILAWCLANSICAQGGRAKAYGLLVSGVVERDLVGEIDRKMQEILKETEPHRVNPQAPETETSLDIILTGAGELGDAGTEGQSLFSRLAKEEGIDLQELHNAKRLVGDLGYTPLSSTGEEVELFSKGKAQVFYSVASLRVFEAVAANPNKAVILVARHSRGKDKTAIIHASIGAATAVMGKYRRYVSHLVVDEKTADTLLWY